VSRGLARGACLVGLVGVGALLLTTAAGVVSAQAVTEGGLGYDPAETGSLSAITRMVGAQDAWADGYTGAGVDVAVIDTGVARVPGLDAMGKVVDGPDLSLDAASGMGGGLDAYGHGTFMAGIIAGRDAGATGSAKGCASCLGKSGYSDVTKFVGVAPDARIVNVKVGAWDGATDVTQVIAAVDWVTQHAHDPGLNIRVLSLSYGTPGIQWYAVDPLAQAVEQAWKRGIVVVAAAGNDGTAVGPLANPAKDPFVVAVGGDDPNGTVAVDDDIVPAFAQHGILGRYVDLIAPATHVLGLRVPGSYIDTLPENTGQVGDRFQRGSGTSQATAVVAGLAALIAQTNPTATPDQIKGMLTAGAVPLPWVDAESRLADSAWTQNLSKQEYADLLNAVNARYSGHGIANVANALHLKPNKIAAQSYHASSGLGTLDGARGGIYLDDNGVELTGQVDIFGQPYDATAMATATTAGLTWSGGIWNSSRWTGDTWTGDTWTGSTWTGSTWAGSSWTATTTEARTWDGSRWTGSRWTSSRWTNSRWDSSRWSSADWT